MSENTNIDEYFTKSFEFKGNETWTLPKTAYHAQPWSINTLQQMKIHLNSVKGQLNKFPLLTWSDHTKQTDPSSLIKYNIGTKIELLTQAWFKFYECLYAYRLIPPSCLHSKTLDSLHLCEAPGAFVSALNYYLFTNHRKIKWDWNANTLNPYYEGNSPSEMITDDSLIHQTLSKWHFGPDQTGDIRTFANHEALTQLSAQLVTADGSVNCMNDPGEQERHVHHLHYCEVMTALRVLDKGGNFVLKLFTIYEHGTVCLMYLLNCCFKTVGVFKPCSSKSGNSEVYVICRLYRGFDVLTELWDMLMVPYKVGEQETAMFSLDDIDPTFLEQLQSCSTFFMHWQCSRINQNIALFSETNPDIWSCVRDVQERVAETYLEKCCIINIPKGRKLFKRPYKKKHVVTDDSDITVTDHYSQLDDDNLIRINTGRAVDVVLSSCFGSVTTTKLSRGILPEGLPPVYVVINGSSFNNEISHKHFFHLVQERSRCCCDLVISGIPLLTRFLVSIIYILSLGFDLFVVCKGAIVFRDYNEFKFYIVRKHFEKIVVAFDKLHDKEDILEIVPLNVLRKGQFYKAICKYNTEVSM